MANSILHALPYPIYGYLYTLVIPYLDATGTPTDPTTPDTEISIDGGAFADCTNEVTSISGGPGTSFITLTAAETLATLIVLQAKVTSGPKTTLAVLVPRQLQQLGTGASTASSTTSALFFGTLSATTSTIDLGGLIVGITAGTGVGQARYLWTHDTAASSAAVWPLFATAPDVTSEFQLLLPWGIPRESVDPRGGAR